MTVCAARAGNALAPRRGSADAAGMSDKQMALAAIEQLPDEASIQDIAERMKFLAAIREGEEAADAGRVKPLDVVEEQLRRWSAISLSAVRR